MSDSEMKPGNRPVSEEHNSAADVQKNDWDELADRLPKIIRFRDLCRCGDEIWIENDGQLYRLRRTKQGKLILTK